MPQSIARLNADFAISDSVHIVEGEGGLPFIEITTPEATARVSLYAGQVLSYRPAGQAEDLMFLSEKAYYAPGKAIKGGTPICWPWFGADPEGKGRPGHGFARNRMWRLTGTEKLDDGRVTVRVGFSDAEDTRALWPHAFDLELAVTVGPTLRLALTSTNKGAEAFALSQGLHTYFQVGDITKVKVLGLEDIPYLDNLDGLARKSAPGPIVINGETDRIYTALKGDMVIEDAALKRRVRIASGGSNSAVVWNPWIDTTAGMADLVNDAYTRMICVETTNAKADTVQVAAGGTHVLTAEYAIEAL